MNFSFRLHSLIGLLALSVCAPASGVEKPAPDIWLTDAPHHPPAFTNCPVQTGSFTALHAEVLSGQLKILLPASNESLQSARLWASMDHPGHWSARDWRSFPMLRHGTVWDISVPVDNVDVPLIYFIEARTDSGTNLSALRRCLPRAAGLEEPTRVFTPFLEGFEEGLESWRRLTALREESPPLRADSTARHGQKALLVPLPSGKHSVTIATTRVRGWQIEQQFASGLRLWLRTRAGEGRARFTLLANAHSGNEVISVSQIEAALSPQWKKTDLPFSSFPKIPLIDADLFTIEFIGAGPCEFLVDDLQFLGRWKLELE